MALLRKNSVKILSGIIILLMTVLSALTIYMLMINDSFRLNRLLDVGNAWIRLLGILIGIQTILLFIILIISTYKLYSSRAKALLSGTLIGNTLIILMLLTIICSGAARLDAEFTISPMDRQEESILLPTKTVVSDDGNTSVEGDLLWILYDEERMTFSFSMTNKTDIVLNEVRYSILAPNGKIYSGVANISEKNMELLSEKGSFKSEFDVFYPFTSGEYTAEVIFDYYDNLGEKHILNYVTSTKINN